MVVKPRLLDLFCGAMSKFLPPEIAEEWYRRQVSTFVYGVRNCPDCGRRQSFVMEDNSWICEVCGHVEAGDASLETP